MFGVYQLLMKKVFAILGLLIFLTGAVGFWRESQRIADIPKADPTIDPDLDGFIPVLLPPSPTREIDVEFLKINQRELYFAGGNNWQINEWKSKRMSWWFLIRLPIPAIDLDA